MTYKSPHQPLCRYCGKGIRKDTTTHWIDDGKEAKPSKLSHSIMHHYPGGQLFTKEDCQRFTDQQIVSIRKARYGYFGTRDPNRIKQFTTWDGFSWVDQFFCNGDCARRYGYFAAFNEPRLMTQDYANAYIEKYKSKVRS